MLTSSGRTPIWRLHGILPLLVVTSVGFSGYAVLLTVAPLWAVAGGSGSAGAGLVNGVLMLFTVLAQAFVPVALRRFGWGPTLISGLVLLGLPSPLHLLSNDLGVLLGLSAVRGLGFGVLTVAGSAAVAELVEPKRRGEAIGAYGLAIAAPQLVLLPFSPWIAEHLGYGLAFALGACPLLGVVSAAILARRLRDRVPEQHSAAEEAPYGGRRAVLVGLLRPVILLLGVTVAGGALMTFTPQMSADPTATVLGLFLLTATTALSRWRFGTLADRYGTRVFLWPLVILTVIGLAVVSWAVRDSSSTQVVPLLIGLAAVGVSYGGLQNLTLVQAFHSVRRRDYGLASAAWNTGFDAGTGLGAVVVGALAAGFSFPVALLVSAGFSLLTLPLALLPPRRRPGAQPA
ncbi:MFS transporter [Saxibacter everestensis]|uniref:MFS transporter n=1 Tax=Saxibacter everestensis TaxID=2909229 RepID=A0ABY8QUX0_9MICO|nr:MFS transporter [Brevibacteriaceae bacterium ZFBP1038]